MSVEREKNEKKQREWEEKWDDGISAYTFSEGIENLSLKIIGNSKISSGREDTLR